MLVNNAEPLLWQERVLHTLKAGGPQSLEQLCAASGLGLSQLLLTVDHLTRSGQLFMRRTMDRRYMVSADPIPI